MAAKRLLVIAPIAVDGGALREEIERRAGGEAAEVRLIAPAVTESKLKTVLGDVDGAVEDAEARVKATIEGLRGSSVTATGSVGDSDPMIAAEDELGMFAADEVLIVTHRDAEADWFEEDLFERAAERFEPPVSNVELVPAGGGGQLDEVERSGSGRADEQSDTGEIELTENLPPFSKRDLLSIGVAIAGTIVLAILAADSGEDGVSPARTLIAIAFALINLAHVVGLVFFNSQQYRGFGRELFGKLSLYGTPTAIVVSLLI
jgi:hypothetical protein